MLLKTTPKFKQKDLSIEKLCPRGVEGMADLGLHCFLKLMCPKT